MGQIFDTTIYDPKTKKAYSEDSDKFHANCYSYSKNVMIIHYLLRKRPYRVMWCGDYVLDDIKSFSKEKLLGISVSKDLEFFEMNGYKSDHPDYEIVKFIGKSHKSWKKIHFSLNKIYKFFDYKNTKSVRYDGYLINHTKKQAINLKNYYKKSVSLTEKGRKYSIDLIPCLTETGSKLNAGTGMALFDGCSGDVTEDLINKWCGDLLEIVDKPPEDYKIIDCCFASIWDRVRYCIMHYGLDRDSFILGNKKKNRLEALHLNIYMKRGPPSYIKGLSDERGIKFKAIPINEVEENKNRKKVKLMKKDKSEK